MKTHNKILLVVSALLLCSSIIKGSLLPDVHCPLENGNFKEYASEQECKKNCKGHCTNLPYSFNLGLGQAPINFEPIN